MLIKNNVIALAEKNGGDMSGDLAGKREKVGIIKLHMGKSLIVILSQPLILIVTKQKNFVNIKEADFQLLKVGSWLRILNF